MLLPNQTKIWMGGGADNRKVKSKEELMRIVHGKTNQETMEWLQRSILGKTIIPMNCNLIAGKLFRDWLCITINIREMGV